MELGLVGTPTVVAYRVDPIASRLRFLLKVPSVVLTNLVLGEHVYPEYIQEDASPETLVRALERSTSDRVSEHIVEVLPALGPPARAAVPALVAFAERTEDPFLRLEGAAAILELGDPAGLAVLATLLAADPPLLRWNERGDATSLERAGQVVRTRSTERR